MKIRLDKLLVDKNIATSRQQAQALITTGLIKVNGLPATKTASMVSTDTPIEVIGQACPYVSRGGLKLKGAMDGFELTVADKVCADIGASTGGFTDCLLQHGARHVYAVDVGYGQLDWKLRQDPRVTVMERFNARYITPEDLADPIDLATIDASFISLKLLVPPLRALFKGSISIIALIKPQFEAGKGKVGKGGVIRDASLRQEIIDEMKAFAETIGLQTEGVLPSPVLGPKGNQEYLWYLTGKLLPEDH